ncbi:MAG: hypothetical protein CMO16_07105 [Thaumarchaeota archaeon]|nr:hypothetical protein [Nitrososphaerota archaeon]
MNVRIPNDFTDKFSIQLNKLYSDINQQYFENVKMQIQPQKVNVMLADANVTQRDTFDPQKVVMFYEILTKKMKDWSSQEIAKTDTDDLKRLHVLFITSIENYSLSCYFGIQYHALPYYKFDDRIKGIQIEIMELDEKVAKIKEEKSSKENAILEEELKRREMVNLDFEEMLETMYNDKHLYNELTRKVDDIENNNPEYLKMIKRRDDLLEELNNMIIYLYRTSSALLGYNQLMEGEEGMAVYFDLEIIKKGEKSGVIEIEKISPKIKKVIRDRFKEVELVLKKVPL